MSRIYKFFSQWAISLEHFPIAHILLAFICILIIVNVYMGYEPILQKEISRFIVASILAFPLTLIPGVIQSSTKNKKNQDSSNIIESKKTSSKKHLLNTKPRISTYFIWQFLALIV